MWEEGLGGATAATVDAASEVLAVGDDMGHVSLFRFPACGPDSKVFVFPFCFLDPCPAGHRCSEVKL